MKNVIKQPLAFPPTSGNMYRYSNHANNQRFMSVFKPGQTMITIYIFLTRRTILYASPYLYSSVINMNF
jgi:hypothetical protein